jgi:hypothetical protein
VKLAFPVVADPKISWGWRSTTVFFNRSETNDLAFGGASASALMGAAFGGWGGLPAASVAAYASWAAGRNACLRVEILHYQLWMPYRLSHYSGGHCR